MESREPHGSGWILKTLLVAAIGVIISLIGYMHVSTVSNLTTYIDAVKEQTVSLIRTFDARVALMENRVLIIDSEQNKRTSRIDIVERDIKAIESNTGRSLARIEETLKDLSLKVDDLRINKPKG